MSHLVISLLGTFQITRGSTSITAFESNKVRALLAYLAVESDRPHTRDALAALLWPESTQESALNSLRNGLANLRRAIGDREANPPYLLITHQTVQFNRASDSSLDVADVIQPAAGLQQPSSDCQASQVQTRFAAVECYRGPFLEGFSIPDSAAFEEWVSLWRERLEQWTLERLRWLADYYEACREYAPALEFARRQVTLDPWIEEGHCQVMRLLALSGQREQALRQYQTLREVLQAELEAEPGESATQLYNEIRSGSFSTAPPKAVPPHNLPAQLTSFIGREKQIEEVRRLVRESRLVTLTGAGGTGKTRLALQAAGGLLGDFSNGAFLVELAPLSDPQLVPQACVKTLEVIQSPGVSLPDLLAHYLEQKSLLLILDNCEHVISACTHLADMLLKACPRLHILATSREILSVPGESPFRVPSLEVSNPLALPPLAEMAQVEAVQLFIERAAQAAPGFRLAEANAGAVAQIGQRLDGIPLAIELAAARTRVLTAGQIAARLDNAFHLLTGGSRAELPRHQTLKAMIDWSYNLLSPTERLLLQRLSVFAGGWDLEAAEAVCAQDGISTYDVLDLLTELVDKSLVLAEPRGEGVRYRMLELIRQYARDRLLEESGSEQVRERHLDYFAGLTGQAEPHLRGQGQVEWLDRMELEFDNLRAALEWSMAGRVELGLKIAADLMWFWWIRNQFTEGTGWIKRLLAAETSGQGKPARGEERALQVARALRAYCHENGNLNNLSHAQCLAMLEQSVAILRGLAPAARRELGISLFFLWQEYQKEDENNWPNANLEEMLEIFRQVHEPLYYAEYLCEAGNFKFYIEGDIQGAQAFIEESLAICRENGDLDGVSKGLEKLTAFTEMIGDYARSEALLKEAIEISRQVRNRKFEVELNCVMCYNLLANGCHEEAIRLAEAGLTIEQETEIRYPLVNARPILQVANWSAGNYEASIRVGREIVEHYPEGDIDNVMAHFHLGRAALSQGDLANAETELRQAVLPLNYGYYYKFDQEQFLEGWAALLARQGKLAQAVRVLGAGDAIYRLYGLYFNLRVRGEHEAALQAARLGLGEEAFAAAWQEGQKLTLAQAAVLALAETEK